MRKLSKITSLLFTVFIFSSTLFGQTPQNIEQELNKNLDNLQKYSFYAGTYDENITPKAQEQLKNNLIKHLKNPATLKYAFPKLKDKMFIATSPDGKFRVYSWNTEDGGTMRNFDAIYQYQGTDGKVYVKPRGDDYEGNSFIAKVYEVSTKSGKVYLTIQTAIASTQDNATSVNAFKITGKTIDNKFKIFKTSSGLTNTIGFAYNFFSVADRKERPILLITFNPQTKVLKIPVVIENKKYPNGEVTNRFINYKFNGTNFVKVS